VSLRHIRCDWKEFILGFIVSGVSMTLLTVVISAMVGADTMLWEGVYATSLMAMAPMIVLCLLLHKYLVRGVAFGAVER